MGVPSFYKWLVEKYPNTVVLARESNGDKVVDASEPNPNGMEFDNLYLDMCDILYTCLQYKDEDEQIIFERIFIYIDRLFQIVRPRKLLYMAMDGVSPRAKINEQRSRRFRKVKYAEIVEAEEERLRKEFELIGKKVLPSEEVDSEVLESEVCDFLPGTVVMDKFSKALQIYIRTRLNTDPGWKTIKVILSDVNVPGEGEHKIMQFIRLQRKLDGYDPNTRHCVYGHDADLIMLALATHELHFSILREARLSNGVSSPPKTPFEFLNIWTLREYLELDLKISEPPFEIDIERIVDDFIFICFFLGNDFLPHLPTLEIREGAINLMMAVYRDEFKSRGGYLVDMQRVEEKKGGYVNLERIERFILFVGTYEDRIFKKRLDIRERIRSDALRKLSEDKQDDPLVQAPICNLDLNSRSTNAEASCAKDLTLGPHQSLPSNDLDDILKNTEELEERALHVVRKQGDLIVQGGMERDKIRLGMHGWRGRYYKEKFMCKSAEDIENARKSMVEKYVEGLCWLLQTYFFGVPSWSWFYPYHYVPFASDLKGLTSVHVKFNMGTPFKPFDALMGIIHPRGIGDLPEAFRPLMTSKQSPLIKFYPTDFEIDSYGQRYPWQGIVKLEFISEELLVSETKKLEKELNEDEIRRNSVSMDKIFVRRSHGLSTQVESQKQTKERRAIDACFSDGINGFIHLCDEVSCLTNSSFCVNGAGDNVICAQYECPDIHLHVPRLLENVTIPEKTISEADIKRGPLWHEYEGFNPTRLHVQQMGSSYTSSPREISKGVGSGWNTGRGKGYLASSPKEIFKGEGSGFSAGRGKGYLASSSQNFGSTRGIWAENNIKQEDSGSSLGSGNWDCRTESSWNRNSRSFHPQANSCKGTSPVPFSIGQGRTGFSESSWNNHLGSFDPQENGCKMAFPGPSSIGRGRVGVGTNTSEAHLRANGSHPPWSSGRGPRYPDGNLVEKKRFWPSRNVTADGRTNGSWRRQDSSSDGMGQ